MKTTEINIPVITCRIVRAFTLSLFTIFSFQLTAYSQCLTNNLIINTGEYNYTSLGVGSTDPLWTVSDKASIFFPVPPVGANAVLVSGPGVWGFMGTAWICDTPTHANTLAPSAGPGDYMTFKREFRTCEDGDITFDANILVDDYVKEVKVDGITVPGVSQSPGTYYSTPWNMNFSQLLSAGSHSLEIVVSEYSYLAQGYNPIGMSLQGTISSPGNIIVNNFDANCDSFTCEKEDTTECRDKCFWKVKGNTILNSNHIFGTRNNFSVDFVTNNSYRGIFTPGGSNSADPSAGRFGWNTMTPTARLHVNCRFGNNPDETAGQPSDIRFEHLEPGNGNILVIDQDGYIYDSHMPVGADSITGGIAMLTMQQEIRELKTQLADLRKALAADKMTFNNNILYQNNPNPFDRETVIEFSIADVQQIAYIGIYDLNGREIMKYPVNATGKGKVAIDGSTLQPGMYVYSLVVDGKIADTRKMVLSK